ncbi:MAG: hypothetical protein HY238_11350 [Acidobacteria bacterium]|nr:hypothetical protein [Acidobacteriota bacterium]
MQPTIPLYAADGELCDWISEQRMARLDRLGLIRVVRHKKGHVARCILHRRPGDPKLVRLADYLGTRYSFREHLDNGRLCWRLRRLGRGDELRPVFLRVVADCLIASP